MAKSPSGRSVWKSRRRVSAIGQNALSSSTQTPTFSIICTHTSTRRRPGRSSARGAIAKLMGVRVHGAGWSDTSYRMLAQRSPSNASLRSAEWDLAVKWVEKWWKIILDFDVNFLCSLFLTILDPAAEAREWPFQWIRPGQWAKTIVGPFDTEESEEGHHQESGSMQSTKTTLGG